MLYLAISCSLAIMFRKFGHVAIPIQFSSRLTPARDTKSMNSIEDSRYLRQESPLMIPTHQLIHDSIASPFKSRTAGTCVKYTSS